MKPEKSVKREKEREDEEKKKTCAFLVIDLARSWDIYSYEIEVFEIQTK